MKVGIVICAWNCAADVERAARSAVATCEPEGLPFGVLVHDDHSEVEPLESAFLAWNLPISRYVRQPERRGLTAAWNAGISWAMSESCEAVVLCNQDILFVDGWLSRFVEDLKTCPALSPLSNSPGVHSHPGTLQAQDVRRYLPEFAGKDIGPTPENFMLIMGRIARNRPVQVRGIKGFFLGFRCDWLWEHRVSDAEFYSMERREANGGVGGAENELFHRVGILPWVAANVYVHHFRPGGAAVGGARALYRALYRRDESEDARDVCQRTGPA